MSLKAAIHFRPIRILSSSPLSSPSPHAFTSNANIAAQHAQTQGAAAVNTVVSQAGAVGFAGTQGGAGAGSGGFHAGRSGFSGYTGSARAFLQATPTQSQSTRQADEDDNDDLSNPNSRASLIQRARQHRPSPQTQDGRSGRRGSKLYDSRPIVRYIDVEAGNQSGLKAIEEAPIPRLEAAKKLRTRMERELMDESAIDLEDLPVIQQSVRSRNSSSIVNTTTSAPNVGSLWTVGLAPARKRHDGERDVLKRAGLIRHFGGSGRIPKNLEVEEEVEAILNVEVGGWVAPRTPSSGTWRVTSLDDLARSRRSRSVGRARSMSTSAVESESPREDVSVLHAAANSGNSSEKQILDELRTELKARDDHVQQEIKTLTNAYSEAKASGRNGEKNRLEDLLRNRIDSYRNPPALDNQGLAMSSSTPPPYFTTQTYNAVLEAYLAFRTQGGTIRDLLVSYNEMLERNVIPNIRTYGTVIKALSIRGREIHVTNRTFEERLKWLNWEKQFVDSGMYTNRQIKSWQERFQAAEKLGAQCEQLLKENNYRSAVKVFTAASTFNPTRPFDSLLYRRLLEDAIAQKDVATADMVFAHYKQAYASKFEPHWNMFTLLIRAHTQTKDLAGAQSVFEQFLLQKAAQSEIDAADDTRLIRAREVYCAMLGAYVQCDRRADAEALWAEMQQATEESEKQPANAPRLTGTAVMEYIRAFVEVDPSGQLAAEQLFNYHDVLASANADSGWPPAPAYDAVVQAALFAGDANTACRAMTYLLSPPHQTSLAHLANVLVSHVRSILKLMQFDVMKSQPDEAVMDGLLDEIVKLLHGAAGTVVRVTGSCNLGDELGAWMSLLSSHGRTRDVLELLQTGKFDLSYLDNASQDTLQTLMEQDLQRPDATMVEAVGYGLALSPLAFRAPDCATASFICRKYVEGDNISALGNDSQTWRLIMDALVAVATRTGPAALTGQSAIDFDESFKGFTEILSNLPESSRPSVDEIRTYAMLLLTRTHDQETLHRLLQCVKPRDIAFLEQNLQKAFATPELSESSTADIPSVPTSPLATPFVINFHLNSIIDGHCLARPSITPFSAYELVKSNLKQGKAPSSDVLARLLQSISRSGDESKVQDLYEIAHQALTLASEEEKFPAFVFIEDNMMIAQLHLGHTDRAMQHRDVIFQVGGVPSADAYATMISFAKDSTDDANVAREMFAESERRGVKPNLYLFNTIISKLSKARKAESAIELFKRMKAEQIRPSSVTYGAVINACCRVGDATSAATLFNEMQSMRGFKPRVPPYNTMMQLHLTTKPSRDLVLHYYDQMVQHGVAPSAHTYKLLLDAFGTLSPIDLPAMDQVFANLSRDGRVTVQGTHWTSRIYAYGVIAGDAQRAEEIFNEISSHPSFPAHGKIEPVCWEAILSVFAQYRMIDKMEEYADRMRAEDIRGTAYINNMLIKGYAVVGRIEDARKVFDSMHDSVTGFAAPNNHPTLLTSSGNVKPAPTAPTSEVFREPSSYEMMIRSELLVGDRERAQRLCDQMEERQYPVPVTARIIAAMHEPATVQEAALMNTPRTGVWTAPQTDQRLAESNVYTAQGDVQAAL